MQIVFFGSFQHYSAIILESLITSREITVAAVVTTPPSPTGRNQSASRRIKNPVHQLADKHTIPVFTPESLNADSLSSLNHDSRFMIHDSQEKIVDFFLVAGYGKLLPPDFLRYPTHGSLNLHFSLLPKYRGANPAEWALLLGETQTGITLIEMSQNFDQGAIIAKKETAITPKDTRETLYQKLYTLGARELPAWLKRHYNWQQKKDFDCQQSLSPTPQPQKSPTPYASRFSRQNGLVDWRIIQAALAGQPFDSALLTGHLLTAYEFLSHSAIQPFNQYVFLERMPRALAGFPSLWTTVKTPKGDKRLKILSFAPYPKSQRLSLDQVQLEGYNPTSYNQIKNQII